MPACNLLRTNHTQRDGNIILKRWIFHISNDLHLFTSKLSCRFIRFSTEYLPYRMIYFSRLVVNLYSIFSQ